MSSDAVDDDDLVLDDRERDARARRVSAPRSSPRRLSRRSRRVRALDRGTARPHEDDEESTRKTYADAPEKWARRAQSREMLQYGTFTHGNRCTGKEEALEALPRTLRDVLDELCANGVLGEDEKRTMDSCTINAYERGRWIPPHIDNPEWRTGRGRCRY